MVWPGAAWLMQACMAEASSDDPFPLAPQSLITLRVPADDCAVGAAEGDGELGAAERDCAVGAAEDDCTLAVSGDNCALAMSESDWALEVTGDDCAPDAPEDDRALYVREYDRAGCFAEANCVTIVVPRRPNRQIYDFIIEDCSYRDQEFLISHLVQSERRFFSVFLHQLRGYRRNFLNFSFHS